MILIQHDGQTVVLDLQHVDKLVIFPTYRAVDTIPKEDNTHTVNVVSKQGHTIAFFQGTYDEMIRLIVEINSRLEVKAEATG